MSPYVTTGPAVSELGGLYILAASKLREKPSTLTRALSHKERGRAAGSDRGRGADIKASERRVPALTAELDCFELVEGLDVLPVEMGFIAHDLCEGVGDRERTQQFGTVDSIAGGLGKLAFGERAGGVGVGAGQVVLGLIDVPPGVKGLVEGHTAELPEGEGDLSGEDELEDTFGLEAVDNSLAVPLPLFGVLDTVDDGDVGANAVLGGVAAGDGLAGVCFGAAFGYGSPLRWLIAVDVST